MNAIAVLAGSQEEGSACLITKVQIFTLPIQPITPTPVATPSARPRLANPGDSRICEAEGRLSQHPHPGARRLAVHPVHRDVALDARHQLVRDDPQRWPPITRRALWLSARAS